MSDYATAVREALHQEIAELSKISWLFSQNPEKDFSRKSPLTFTKLIHSLICMGGNSIQVELLKLFHMHQRTPTASAFVQQRSKIMPEALAYLFDQFNHQYPCWKTFEGYRLLACDGSDIVFTANAQDKDKHITNDAKGYNLLHLNAMYDICNRRYVDAILQKGRYEDEIGAAVTMIDRIDTSKPTIVLADRGYEAYNLLAHAHEKGLFYLIRAKKKGIVTACKPNHRDEFDMPVSRTLTRKQTKAVKETIDLYTILPKDSRFDFCDLHHDLFYTLDFRVVCVKLENGELEYLLTNLPQDIWSTQRLKSLYHLRWGIETSFRELDYAIGLNNFHAKKAASISQEIFARLILHNVCEIIIVHAMTFHRASRGKGLYQLNFTTAIQICKHFLLEAYDPPPDVIALLLKYILPIRPNRSDPRKVKPKSPSGFLYRVA